MIPAECPRCGGDMGCSIGSMFNLQQICCGCKDVERKHPKYREAVDAEVKAVLGGDYNFPGIGLPPELERRKKEKV